MTSYRGFDAVAIRTFLALMMSIRTWSFAKALEPGLAWTLQTTQPGYSPLSWCVDLPYPGHFHTLSHVVGTPGSNRAQRHVTGTSSFIHQLTTRKSDIYGLRSECVRCKKFVHFLKVEQQALPRTTPCGSFIDAPCHCITLHCDTSELPTFLNLNSSVNRSIRSETPGTFSEGFMKESIILSRGEIIRVIFSCLAFPAATYLHPLL
jgi:hypothetical protein